MAASSCSCSRCRRTRPTTRATASEIGIKSEKNPGDGESLCMGPPPGECAVTVGRIGAVSGGPLAGFMRHLGSWMNALILARVDHLRVASGARMSGTSAGSRRQRGRTR